jgi:hypothetical protein
VIENSGISQGFERCDDISQFGQSALGIFARDNLLQVVREFLRDLLSSRTGRFAA